MTELTPTQTLKQGEMVSRAMVRAIVALLIGVLALVSYATFTGRTPSAVVPEGAVVKSRLILIQAEDSGAARIFTAEGKLIADLSAKQGGFISSIDRSLRRKRVIADLPQAGPVLLTLDDLNRLKISDPQSGWSADLMAFGRTNIGAFATLLDAPTKGN